MTSVRCLSRLPPALRIGHISSAAARPPEAGAEIGRGADHAQRSGRRVGGAVLAGGARRRPVVDEASRRVRGVSA